MKPLSIQQKISETFNLSIPELIPSESINIIIGPNGSGKSCLLDFLSQTEVLQERGVSYMTAERDFSSDLYVRELLEIFDIELPVPLAELEDKLKNSLSQLSSGQIQRLFLHCHLAMPKLPTLLLDEPTNFLDPHYKHLLVPYLQKSSKQIFMATHDISWAIQFPRAKGFLIDEGRCIYQGPIHKLVESLEMQKAFRLSFEVVDNKETDIYNLKVAT